MSDYKRCLVPCALCLFLVPVPCFSLFSFCILYHLWRAGRVLEVVYLSSKDLDLLKVWSSVQACCNLRPTCAFLMLMMMRYWWDCVDGDDDDGDGYDADSGNDDHKLWFITHVKLCSLYRPICGFFWEEIKRGAHSQATLDHADQFNPDHSSFRWCCWNHFCFTWGDWYFSWSFWSTKAFGIKDNS